MFQDKRSKKIVLVAHCILNQNSKIDACAYYPGAILEATKTLLNADVGIIQMPCPELLYLGLDREADPTANCTIESEDTRVAFRMKEEQAKTLCQSLVDCIVYQVEEYIKHGFQIVGLIGINGSPTCGIETTWADDHALDGRGVFIDTLEQSLKNKSIFIKLVGIRAKDPQHAIATIENLLNN
ncbi:putative secreted protein [Sporomusaceae bacterium BoRhaA]|uniref:CD3072 family TudS-related putative desulfidase n=1 Tax=Pelorhabdus rhamnosifermentans TaxID=2772457 RepID=UPI001C0621F5|nr:CD3072 family TudS-related putative desulfidase [Pelorhabdus rhamnosifermentans]MBU2700595.1 putative secreted protein [Pelorhabdus rhamnosifermentans]